MSKNKKDAAVMAQFEENAKRPFGLRDKIGYAADFYVVQVGSGPCRLDA